MKKKKKKFPSEKRKISYVRVTRETEKLIIRELLFVNFHFGIPQPKICINFKYI